MASDLSSSENLMDDEKEEGELSLEDVSSSEEGQIYSKLPPKKFGQCPYCLSTKLCATWCRSLTVNNKNNQRDVGLHGKENHRVNHHRVKDAPEVQQSQKKKKCIAVVPINDLVPISSESDMESVDTEEKDYIRRKTKSSKIRRKHRKKSPSMLLSPVSQDIALSIKKSIHKLNTLEQLELMKKESSSGHPKHHHNTKSNKLKPKSLPVSKKRSRSPPNTRSRTRKRTNSESPALKKRGAITKKLSPVSSKVTSVDSPETPSAREKVTKLLKKVRQLEPYSSRISEKRSLKDKLSGMIKNKGDLESTDTVNEKLAVQKDNKTVELNDKLIEIEIVPSKLNDVSSLKDEEVKPETSSPENKTVENSEVKVSSKEVLDTKPDNSIVSKPEEVKTEVIEKQLSMPSLSLEVSASSRPASPLPSSPLSISPTPPETDQTHKLPNFCMDDNDEDLELRLIALRSAVIKKHQTRMRSGAAKKKLKRQKQQGNTPVPELESPFQSEFQKEFPMLAEICMSPDSAINFKDDIYCPEDMELDSDMELDDCDSPYSPTDDVGEITIDKGELAKPNQSLYSPSAPTETPQLKYYKNPSKESGLEGSFLELDNHETRPYSPTDVPYYDPEFTVENKTTKDSFCVPTMQPMGVYPTQPFMLGCSTSTMNQYIEPMPVLPASSGMASLPVNPLYSSLLPSYPLLPMASSNTITPPQTVTLDLSAPFQQVAQIPRIANNELDIEGTDLDGSPLVPEDYKPVPWPPVRGQPMYYENILENMKSKTYQISQPEFKEKTSDAFLQSHGDVFKQPTMKPVVVGNNVVYGGRFRPTKVKPLVEKVLTTQSAAAFNVSNSDFDDETESENSNHLHQPQTLSSFEMTSSSTYNNKLSKETNLVATATTQKKKKKKKGKLKNSSKSSKPVGNSKKSSKECATKKENNTLNDSKEKSTDDDEETLRRQLLDSLAKKLKNQNLMKNLLSRKNNSIYTNKNKDIPKTDQPKNVCSLEFKLEESSQQQLPPNILIKRPTTVLEQSIEKVTKRSKTDASDTIVDKILKNQEQRCESNISVPNNLSVKVDKSNAKVEERPESPDTTESQRIIINLDQKPETEAASRSEKMKPESATPSLEFEKSVDQFLKNLRQKQERSAASSLENSQEATDVASSFSVTGNTDAEKQITVDFDPASSATTTPKTKATDTSSPDENAMTVKITYNDIKTVTSSAVTTTGMTVTTTSTTTSIAASLSVTVTKAKAAFTVSLGPPVAETGARARPISAATSAEKNKAMTSVPRVVKPGLVPKTGVQLPASCSTPQVVKHLPASQQEEYRRLKLKLLEREKLLQRAKESSTASSLATSAASSSTGAMTTSSINEKTLKTRPVESTASSISKQSNAVKIISSIKSIKTAPIVSENNKTSTTDTNTFEKNSIIPALDVNNASVVNIKQKTFVNNQDKQVNEVDPKVSSTLVSNLIVPKIEKQDSNNSNSNLSDCCQTNAKVCESSEILTNCKSKQTWEDFKRLVNNEVQNLSDFPSEDQKKLLSKTEEELVSKRHSVLDDITEMSSNLRQWEVERDLQNIISIEIKNLREQLRIAEEKFQRQKEKMNVIQPKVSMYHGKINEGRKECFRLAKICDGLGSKIIGPNYKAPTAAAELLNNRIKEVAHHTQKLRSKKVTVKKLIKTNVKKIDNQPKNNNNETSNLNMKIADNKFNTIKKAGLINEKNISDSAICKTITILSPHSINLKAERQLNTSVFKNDETKKALNNINIPEEILLNVNNSNKESEKQDLNEIPNVSVENIGMQQLEPHAINSNRDISKIISIEKNKNCYDYNLKVNSELNNEKSYKKIDENSDYNTTLNNEIKSNITSEVPNPPIKLENNSDSLQKMLDLNTEKIISDNNLEANNFNLNSRETNVESEIEPSNLADNVASTVQKTVEVENKNFTGSNNDSSVLILPQTKNTDDLFEENELSNENNLTPKSLEIIDNSQLESSETKTEIQTVDSLEYESTKSSETKKQSDLHKLYKHLRAVTNATVMEIDTEPEILRNNQTSDVQKCQTISKTNDIADTCVEIKSNRFSIVQPTPIESLISKSGTETELNGLCESTNSSFITSTPNKVIETSNLARIVLVNTIVDSENDMYEPKLNSTLLDSENTTQISLEDHLTESNGEKIISKPASTMLGIKEKILHAENILNQVMLKLSKETNIKTMISHKKSGTGTENRKISALTLNKNLTIPEKKNDNATAEVPKLSSENKTVNAISNNEPICTVSNVVSNLVILKGINSETVNHPKNIGTSIETSSSTKKVLKPGENFENNSFEICRDSENSTLLEEIALLELTNEQEVPDEITYKKSKKKSVTEKYPNSSSEQVVKINFPHQYLKKKTTQASDTAANSVSHIKINLSKAADSKNEQVRSFQPRLSSKDLQNVTRETVTTSQQIVQSLKPTYSSQVVQNLEQIRKKNARPRLDQKTEVPKPPTIKKFDRPYESVLRHLNTPRYSKPNGVLCPFQLRGTCNDGDCQFVHQSSHC